MAAERFQLTITGLDQTLAALHQVPITVRDKMLAKALRAGGLVVRDAARRVVPIGRRVVRRGRVVSLPGTVHDAISVRVSKNDAALGLVGVFINVRPARGLNRGRNNPNDPFYWRFIEFGTSKMVKRPFLEPAAQTLGGPVMDAITTSMTQQIARITPKGTLP
jgi:HK97 gp10 family phage protein